MNIQAVIFDFNGTVIADELVWAYAFKKVLKELGVDEKREYPHVGGIGLKENWPILLEKYKIKTAKTLDQLTHETRDIYLENIPKIDLKRFCQVGREITSQKTPYCPCHFQHVRLCGSDPG